MVRAAELRRWVDSGECTSHLTGSYPRREDDADAKLSDAAREAVASCSVAFQQSQDALGKLVPDLAGVAGSLKIWLDEKLRRDFA